MDDLLKRKSRHLDVVLSGKADFSVPAGFDSIRFEHCALPELDLKAIDLSSVFLGKTLNMPYLVSSMTGGPERAGQINIALVEAAQELGFAMAVGSQRIAVTSGHAHGIDASLRKRAPDILLLANLGAVQLVNELGIDEAKRAVDLIEADALILHFNPLQEALQSDGDHDWRGVEAAVASLARALPVPVIAKEVGFGITPLVAKRLVNCGVAVIDVAGLGGTSWAAVEGQRQVGTSHEVLGELFRDWGMPTADLIADVATACPGIPVIASGGIRHGLDGAKAIRLGAAIVGQAGAVLKAAIDGPQAVVKHVSLFADALRLACFATGSGDIEDLRKAPLARLS
jgi:isopentenyl-diphosphate Delta-isomerase